MKDERDIQFKVGDTVRWKDHPKMGKHSTPWIIHSIEVKGNGLWIQDEKGTNAEIFPIFNKSFNIEKVEP